MTLKIVPATREDIVERCGFVPSRVQAFTAFEDDRRIAVGGFMHMPIGGVLMFLDITPEIAKKYPVSLVKTFKRLLDLAHELGKNHIFATCDYDNPVALRFLKRLGFEYTEEGFLKWHP